MFSFLNPVFLFAAASVIIPIVLHMIQSRRTVKLPFSTIRFLKLAEQNASRRIKMEHFLLWLLRTLLLLTIALAFAMPMLRTQGFGDFLKRSQRDVAIVIDTSYSMNYVTGSGTVWDQAVQAAVAILDDLKPGDQVCIYAADGQVRPVIEMLSQELELARASVKALQPGFFSSQLAPAIMAANDSLKEEPRKREREIHVITDNQALPWKDFGEIQAAGVSDNSGEADPPEPVNAAGWNPAELSDRTAVFFTLLGVPSPENSAPADIEIFPENLMDDTTSRLTVKLAHSGSPRETSVSAYIDDVQLASRSVTAGAADASSPVFVVPPLSAGVHRGRIELPPDNLPTDNTFYFLLESKGQMPTLCIGSRADTLFLMKALTVSVPDVSDIEVRQIDPAGIMEEPLADYACIFLCNAIPLSGQETLKIERVIRSGSLLVFFPGNKAETADYEAWSCMPATPIGVRNVPTVNRKTILRWRKPQHPIVRELAADTVTSPLLTLRRYLELGEPRDNVEEVISAGAETPFLLEGRFGNGSVALFTIPADRSWSSFPLSPYYLPLIRELVQYGTFLGGFTPFVWTTRALPLARHLPEATQASDLRGPDGKAISISASVDGNETVLHADNLLVPGICTMQNASGEPVPVLAVNISRTESNLTPIDPSAIREITGLRDFYVAFSREELLKRIEEHRIGRTMGEPLLWLVLLLAVLEFFYANMLSRSAPRLSESLGIVSSGTVKG